jgi:hypothetical protein
MKLLASGCSFIYGSELSDERPGTGGHSYSTYPALLARHLNLEYVCAARPGYGNDSIVRSVIENLDTNVELVVVNWSYLDRYEYYHPAVRWQNLGAVTSKNNRCYDDLGELSKLFFTNLTPEYSWYKYLADIVFLQELLKNHKIPYIFTTAESNFYNKEEIVKLGTGHANLYNMIDFESWHSWEWGDNPVGFVAWAGGHYYPVGNNGHPLETAHHATFELLKEKANKLLCSQ